MTRALLVLLLCAACATPKQPGDVFDAYLEAYADGDAEAVWSLSTPEARLDARRLRLELVAGLSDADPANRVAVEGLFGVTIDDIRPLDDKAFFSWAMGAIRRRLGPGFVRRTVSGMSFVRIEADGPGVAVVYREANGVESRLPLRKVDGAWRVDISPFPKGKPDQ